MRARKFLLPIILFILCSATAMAQWNEVKSQNFTVLTDTNQGRDVALRFEQMRAVYGTILHKTEVNLPTPLTIIGFRNQSEMKANGPLYNGKPIDLGGYFQPGEDRNHIIIDLSAEEKWSVVFHEYAHLLLNGNYPQTQAWFDEGFAEYYGATHITGKQVELGQAPPSASVLSDNHMLMPTLQLFSVAHDSKTYNETGHARQLFYAQSWLVVHWIFENHKLPELSRYFDGVMNRKVPIAEAFQAAFGMDTKQFDKVITNYLRIGRGGVMRLPVPDVVDPSSYVSRKLNDIQTKAVLAELHAHMIDRHKQAVDEFKAVLAVEPDNEVAHRGLGFEYLREHDMDAAAEHIRRAAALNENDARVHYYNAVLLNRGAQDGVESQSRAQQMNFELQKAVQIDPTYADAYSLLSFTQLSMRKPEEALQSAKKAVELSPRNEMFLFNLAEVQLQLGNTDAAQTIFRILQSSTNPAVAARALSALSNVTQVTKQQQQWAEQGLNNDPTDPRWKPREDDKKEKEDVEEEAAPVKHDVRRIEFLKGTLLTVDCSSQPAATLSLTSAGKTWHMQIADRAKVVLIGAEQFSCGWKNVKVAVNYKNSGALQGDIISLELQ